MFANEAERKKLREELQSQVSLGRQSWALGCYWVGAGGVAAAADGWVDGWRRPMGGKGRQD